MNIRSTVLLVLLIGAGFLGNYYSISLFFGADFLFGSIAVLLVLYFYGLGWGMLAAVLVQGYTYFLWGHPYGFLNFISEALFVGLFLKRGYRNLLVIDGVFWLLLGMPLAWFYHGVVLHMDGTTASFIMLKQGINGIFNALLVNLAICYLPLGKLFQRPQYADSISLQESLYNLLVLMVLLPALLLTLVETRKEKKNLEAEMVQSLQSVSANLQVHLHSWFQQRLQVLQELAGLASIASMTPTAQLQHETEILKQAFPNFRTLQVENAAGRTIASSPKINAQGQSTLGLDVSQKSWFKEAKAKKYLVISQVVQGRGAVLSPILVLSVPSIRENHFLGTATGSLDLSMVQKILKPYSWGRPTVITLTDSQHQVIASTAPERIPLQVWDRHQTGVCLHVTTHICHWQPVDRKLPSMTRWRQSFYVLETSMQPELPWKLTIEIPVAPLQLTLYTIYVKNLTVMALLTALALFFSLVLSRWLTRPLAQLSLVTADLPQKLSESQTLDWPSSSALEVNALIMHAKSMAGALEANFHSLQAKSEELSQANRELLQEIRERQMAEEALRASEERYRLLFNNVSDAVFVHEVSSAENTPGRFIEVNDIACQYLGYTREELLQMTVLQIDAPETIAVIPSIIKKLFAEKRMLWEGIHLGKDGRKIPVEISNQLFDLDGKPMILSTVRNIEKRKRAEQALMSRQAELDGIFRAAPIGIGVLTNRVLKEVNDQVCSMTGYTREELVGKDSRLLYPTEEDFACMGLEKYQMVDQYGIGSVETCWQRQDGAIIDVRLTSVPIMSADSAGDVLFTAIDITERKKSDQAFRTLMESSLSSTGQNYFDIVVNKLANWLDCEITLVGELIDSNTVKILSRLVDGNLFHDGFYHLKDTPCDEIETKGFCFHSQGVQELFPQAQNLKDLKANSYVGIPIRDSQNQVIGTLCAISRHMLIPPPRTKEVMQMMAVKSAAEIQRQRMEREKENIESQLRQAQKMEAIGTLAGGIAHDFNNILGAIMGFTELTLQSVPRDSQEHYNLKQVLNAGERAKDLVKQILVFSRRAGQEKIPLQVSSLIKETLKLLRASLPTTIEIKENLASQSAMVLADSTQFHQILMNLGANAAHAMRENGGLLEVNLQEVSLDRSDLVQHPELTPGPYVVLTVRDTGCGIDQAIIGRIFEPFYTTKEVGEGTGMGLAVVHGIVKSCGGEITVASRPGEGTTFTILLPKITGEVAMAAAVPAPLPTGNESILFVDDEAMLVNLTREMLKKLGYQVVVQTSSLEALKIFQAQPEKFDLVITDQTMPHMTGLQLAQEFRHLRPDIPIILCTGYSEKVSLQNIKAAGINDLLMKPFVMRNLAETIRKVLD
jgi:PAS domain S-box-containing protein